MNKHTTSKSGNIAEAQQRFRNAVKIVYGVELEELIKMDVREIDELLINRIRKEKNISSQLEELGK